MKNIILIFSLIISYSAYAESVSIVQISPKYCKEGVHNQPNGSYAIYVFCDDALGTNIAIFLNKLNDPFKGKYQLTKRFWQSSKWGADVTSFSWLPNNKSILISTSAIYGSGKVYKLELESQKESVIYSPNQSTCLTEITEVSNNKLSLKITDCESNTKGVKIEI